jgi:hypothetical protein
MTDRRLCADFNGLFGDVLCLSHGDTCKDESGQDVVLRPGMVVSVYEEDIDELGQRDDLTATGTIEPSPNWLQCRGSRWILRIDRHGVRHESDIKKGL